MTQSLWAEFSSDGFEFVVAETWPCPDKTYLGEKLAQGVRRRQGLLALTMQSFTGWKGGDRADNLQEAPVFTRSLLARSLAVLSLHREPT